MDTEPSARSWLFTMFDTMKRGDLTRMTVTLWAICHVKRKIVHEEIYQSPMATVAFVNRFLDDLGESKEPPKKQPGKGHVSTRGIEWIAPPSGCAKVNVDATVTKSESKGAVGA